MNVEATVVCDLRGDVARLSVEVNTATEARKVSRLDGLSAISTSRRGNFELD